MLDKTSEGAVGGGGGGWGGGGRSGGISLKINIVMEGNSFTVYIFTWFRCHVSW